MANGSLGRRLIHSIIKGYVTARCVPGWKLQHGCQMRIASPRAVVARVSAGVLQFDAKNPQRVRLGSSTLCFGTC